MFTWPSLGTNGCGGSSSQTIGTSDQFLHRSIDLFCEFSLGSWPWPSRHGRRCSILVTMIRRVIAGLGRTFIAVGVLLLLFVAYQLWGTGIAEARSQRILKTELAANLGIDPKLLDQLGVNPDVTLPTEPEPATRVATTVAEVPDIKVPGLRIGADGPPETDPSTVVTPPRETTTTVFHSKRPQLRMKAGQAIGVIRIPKIHLTKYLVEGTAVEDLKHGPGHYAGTKLPGEPGLAAIAGHRTTYGNPFFDLDKMRAGDEIIVASQLGVFRYKTLDLKVVKPSDSAVLDDKGGRNLLVLTTCHPKFSASRRLVLTAELEGEGVQADLIEPTTLPTIPTTTLAPATTVAPTTTIRAVDPGLIATTIPWPTRPVDTVPAAATTSAPAVATTPANAPGGPALAEPLSGRKFAFGWFAGPAHVWWATLGWTTVCALVWLTAWLVAKRRRRYFARLGVYAGFFVPFVFVLFFCYENLARLLPENI